MAIYTQPGLRAGWEPDTPVGDTLVHRYVHSFAASNLGPVRALGGRTLERDDVAAADLGRPTGFLLNTAVLLRPVDQEDAGVLLEALDDFYGAGGASTVTLFSAWPTPDLRSHGWQLEGHPPMLVRPPSGPVDDSAADAVPEGVRIVEADTPERIDDWSRVAVDGFPFEELQPYRPGSLLDDRILGEDRLRLWVGYDGDGPVCIGALFVEHELGQLWLAATLPTARGRGYYRAMANHRINAAPSVPLAAIFSDMSRPAAEKHLGFLPVIRFTLWSKQRPSRQER